MAESTRKTCARCREQLPASNFYKNSSSKTGLSTYCKACSREKLRENRAKNPERTRAHGRNNMRRRRERDPEGVADYQRAWRAANPDKVQAAKAAWEKANYEKHRFHANVANRKWRAANRPKVRAYNATWAEANPDRVSAKSKRWRDAHPITVRARKSRRRAMIRSVTVGDADLHILWMRQCGVCSLCGVRIDPSLAWPDHGSKSVDHIVPLAKGGTHEQSNLAWAHLICNIRKGANTP